MIRIAVRRLLWALPSLVVASALIFVLARLAPGDAARVVLGTNRDPDAYARVRAELGLDRPLLSRYAEWVGDALRGDLGQSIFTRQDVVTLLNSRLSVSLTLIVGATLLAAALGVTIGVLGALNGGVTSRVADATAMVGMSVPTFWLGLLLIFVFAIQFPILPATGYVPFAEDPGAWARSLVLPVFTLSLAGIATIAKQTRGALLDTMSQEYVRAIRANGLPARRVVLRHCLKNAAVPVMTTVGLVLVVILGGTVLVEQVFGLPGMGQLAVQATLQNDLPVLAGVVVYYTLFVLISNLLVDLTYGWLSPRIEES